MATTVSVIIGSNEYSLDDGTLVRLVGHDGWGMAPLHRISDRGPEQHGETDLGYRLDPRYGTLVFRLAVTELDTMYSRRNTLITRFAPQNNPILKFDLDYGERRIACHYVGDMSLPWSPNDWATQKLAVRLKAADPTFYDPTERSITFGLGGGGDAFEIPLAIPWEIGASTLDQTVGIDYAGNWLTYPHRIRIAGPITDAVITNVTTGEVLDFTDTTIGDGDYYDIDCRYGYKTVVDADGNNVIDDLTEDSDLGTWHLAADPEAPAGHNDINVTGSAVDEGTEVYVSYYDRFLGIQT